MEELNELTKTEWDHDVFTVEEQAGILKYLKIKYLNCQIEETKLEVQKIIHCYMENGQYKFTIPYPIPRCYPNSHMTLEMSEQCNWDFLRNHFTVIKWVKKNNQTNLIRHFNPEKVNDYVVL